MHVLHINCSRRVHKLVFTVLCVPVQRAFLSAVMKALSSISKQMCEAATVCGVDLFKACAYVGENSAPVFRYYLNLIQGNLQVKTLL